MNISNRLMLLGMLAGCGDVLNGTAVGNMDPTVTLSTPAASDVETMSGSVTVDRAAVLACDGDQKLLAAGVDVSLVGDSRLVVPEGQWCGFVVLLGTNPEWSCTSVDGVTLDVELDAPYFIVHASPFVVRPGDRLVWEIGSWGWLDPSTLGVSGSDVRIAPGSAAHDDLLVAATEYATLFVDQDGDGRLSPVDTVLAGEGLLGGQGVAP